MNRSQQGSAPGEMSFAETPLRRGDGEEPPLAGHALELVTPRSSNSSPTRSQVAQRAGPSTSFALPGRSRAPDVHADPADVIAADLALAGVTGTERWEDLALASEKRTIASKKREARWDRQREGDAAYRAALGIADGGELPKQIGNTTSAGAGRSPRQSRL